MLPRFAILVLLTIYTINLALPKLAHAGGYCSFFSATVTRTDTSTWRVYVLLETQNLTPGTYQMYFNFHGDVATKSVPETRLQIPLSGPGIEYSFDITNSDIPFGTGVVQDRTATFFIAPVNTGDRHCSIALTFSLNAELGKEIPGMPLFSDAIRGLCPPGNINSAIGCIPYVDINTTTAFFIRWTLGIGGGIALFLISTSAIKIMTTKGDPKRVQDARDTLTAAVVGLVLILLSPFVVRFLTITLLRLF